jgi:hypothetical protein
MLVGLDAGVVHGAADCLGARLWRGEVELEVIIRDRWTSDPCFLHLFLTSMLQLVGHVLASWVEGYMLHCFSICSAWSIYTLFWHNLGIWCVSTTCVLWLASALHFSYLIIHYFAMWSKCLASAFALFHFDYPLFSYVIKIVQKKIAQFHVNICSTIAN